MTAAVMVLSVFTTRASGKARWSCSARESSSLTNSVGGKPFEKSNGLAASMMILPERFSSPAWLRTSRDAPPFVALTTSSAPAAASAKVASRTPGCSPAQVEYGGVAAASGAGGGPEPNSRVLAGPGGVRRVADVVGVGAGHRPVRVPGADGDFVAQLVELACQCASHDACPEHGNLHRSAPSWVVWRHASPRAENGARTVRPSGL